MVMSLIESLTRIKNAVYGREVREAIHDGVFRANQIADGADAKADNTQVRQDTLEDFNNQVIQEMTDKDVISAPEIIQARGGKETLGQRLDETTAQLAQKATEISNDLIIYVDNINGSDVNNGGVNNPFKTIQAAINSLPTIITGHVKIKLADGVYTEQTSTYSGASINNYSEKTMTCNVAFTNFQMKEGSSITLEGNSTNPSAVIIDGANAVNTNIFILNTNRINLNGLTVKNATSSNVQYKRYSSGQLKNVTLDNANYGLWGYQYAFVEVQGNVIVKNATQAVSGTIQSYINLAGITVEDSCAAGVSVSNKTDCMMSQTNVLNTNLNIAVSYGCYVHANGVIFSKNIGRVTGGQLYVLNGSANGVSPTNILELRDYGIGVVENVDISSDTDPSTLGIAAIRITDGGELKISNSLIEGYIYGISANDSGKIIVKNTDISNNRYDGINTNKSSSLSIENVFSTTPNLRYGIQSTKTNILLNGSNTISGNSSQFIGNNNFRHLERGTTAERPIAFMEPGMLYFDTTLGKVILYVGSSGYRNLDGTVL